MDSKEDLHPNVKLVIEAIGDCQTVRDLNVFIRMGVWKGRKAVLDAIYKRYSALTGEEEEEGIEEKRFRNAEFWKSVELEWADDEEMEISNPMSGQLGHGFEDVPRVKEPNWALFYKRIVMPQRMYKRSFKGQRQSIKFSFCNLHQLPQGCDLNAAIPNILQAALDTTIEEMEGNCELGVIQSNDLISVSLQHPGLNTPIFLPFSRRDKLTGEKLAREVEKVQQSKKGLDMDEKMELIVTHQRMPAGSS